MFIIRIYIYIYINDWFRLALTKLLTPEKFKSGNVMEKSKGKEKGKNRSGK